MEPVKNGLARADAGVTQGARVIGRPSAATDFAQDGSSTDIVPTASDDAVTTHSTAEEAIAAVAKGEMVIVLDDPGRENEGDLVMAAEHATPAAVAFIVRHTSGVVCVGMTGDRLDELDLPPMVPRNTEAQTTAFTVSVDYLPHTSTGISANDRSATIRALARRASKASDFARPGHVFPLRARDEGVLVRRGHTEAAVDLARLAGLSPAGVLCELVGADGSMARASQLKRFAAKHGLLVTSIEQLARHRRCSELTIDHVSCAELPTRYGAFRAHVFESRTDGVQHLALVLGDVTGPVPVLGRVHSECLTGDVVGSLRCDCGAQFDAAMAALARQRRGVLVYLRGQEGRGIGLGHKLRAYALQDRGLDTVEANLQLGLPIDSRDYGVGAQILRHLGVRRVKVLTNNPHKYEALAGYGVELVGRIPLTVPATLESLAYLRAKRDKLGHKVELGPLVQPAHVDARPETA